MLDLPKHADRARAWSAITWCRTCTCTPPSTEKNTADSTPVSTNISTSPHYLSPVSTGGEFSAVFFSVLASQPASQPASGGLYSGGCGVILVALYLLLVRVATFRQYSFQSLTPSDRPLAFALPPFRFFSFPLPFFMACRRQRQSVPRCVRQSRHTPAQFRRSGPWDRRWKRRR